MPELEWKIEDFEMSKILESINWNDLDSLEYLSHELLLTLERPLGGQLQPFLVSSCQAEFCNTNAFLPHSPFQPVKSDLLETRICISFWGDTPKVAAFLQFFDGEEVGNAVSTTTQCTHSIRFAPDW